MAALMTLDVAKDHLRIRTTDQDADLAMKLDQASAIIMTYLDESAVSGWTASPPSVAAPDNVTAATLYVLEDLYERRPINWDIVQALLVGFRSLKMA